MAHRVRFFSFLAAGLLALRVGAQTDKQFEIPPSLRPDKPQMLLCLPEKLWTCTGVGECYADRSPETVAAWKIDVAGSRYTQCRRDGSDCGDWSAFSSAMDTAFLVLHESAWHPETFKIDRDAGKFVAVRLSGAATDVDFDKKVVLPNLSNFRIIQRTGSCIPIAK